MTIFRIFNRVVDALERAGDAGKVRGVEVMEGWGEEGLAEGAVGEAG